MVAAHDETAVQRLRDLKHREEKPFALMFPSLESAKTVCVISIWLMVANAVLFAQDSAIPPGRWNKVEQEEPGTGLVVTLKGGERIQCFLKSLSTSIITVITTETKEREIPKIAVEKIVTAEKRSGPLWNGAVIGAAIPATIGLAIVAKYPDDSSGAAAGILLMSGIGALLGVGIDAAVRGQVTLYKAPKTKN